MAEYGVIVEKNMRSKGIGKQLLNFVLTYKRTDLDEEGNIYPLLYMNLK